MHDIKFKYRLYIAVHGEFNQEMFIQSSTIILYGDQLEPKVPVWLART